MGGRRDLFVSKPPASTIVKANDKNDQNNSYERIGAELDEGPLLFFLLPKQSKLV